MTEEDFDATIGKPTLQEIARKHYCPDDWHLEDRIISDALTAAGINPSDEQERERFRRLVAAHSRLSDVDHMVRHGRYADED